MKTVLIKEYDGESMVDMERDLSEALDENYNQVMRDIPKDEYGIHQGMFVICLKWIEGDATDL
jgi:U3 small nucleolar ribonucleoprotein component